MKIGITGSSGYLGNIISKKLEINGYHVNGIHRNLLYGKTESLKNEIKKYDVIINLAGATILTRWTAKNMEEIYSSRVVTTQNLVTAIKELPASYQPKKVISASAIGLYKAGKIHDEQSTDYEDGFISKVVQDWEKPLEQLPRTIQKTIFRMAPLLGKKSDTIKNMRLPFKLGIGGTIGNGKQPFPFVHEDDVADAFLWAIEKYDQSQTFNLVAPQNISNKTFTKIFGKLLHRPAVLAVPYFALKLIYGKAAKILVTSPQVVPKALQEANFKFGYPEIEGCLRKILN